MKRTHFLLALAIIFGSFSFVSCESNTPDDIPPSGNQTSFVISATVGDANYLLTTDNLSAGALTTVGTGKETDLGTFWVYHQDRFLYRLVYNQANAGISSSYRLNNQGRIVDRDGTYEIRRFTTMGIHQNHLITASTGALNANLAENISGNNYIPRGFLINNINMNSETIGTNTDVLRADNFLGNGEFVTLSGIVDVNGKIFSAPIPMGMSHYGVVVYSEHILYPDLVKTEAGGDASSAFTPGELQWTQHPNEAWVAIFNDRSFRNSTLIRTDKISYAAGRHRSQYYQMIWATDNGDVYVFSPSYAKVMTDERQRTTLPAGVVRIKTGASDFDPDYYVNIEAQSNGAGFLRTWHITNDLFLLLMYDRPFEPGMDTRFVTANRLAIFEAEPGKLTYINGLPQPEIILSFAQSPFMDNGKVYIPLIVEGQDPAIYIIDAKTATATKGISVRAAAITSVGRLSFN